MNEDNMMRLIIIGATLFIFIFTVTAIVLYYRTAVDFSEVVLQENIDFGEIYEQDLEELVGKRIKGTELINIIKNVKNDTEVIINYGMDYVIPRDSAGNIREGDLGVITKGDNYKISDVVITNNSLTIGISKMLGWPI